ncbi:hypothetical protein [Natrialba taiwanensis]|uniref:hypothetical protein n=1 Tax=Natrialba taiwanensis TaxID=160846 RepID=UPI001268D4F3|nr:hypothetical protein [Natrialba taiwanensis]
MIFPQKVLHWFGKETTSPIRNFDPSSQIPILENEDIIRYSEKSEDYVVSEEIVSNIAKNYTGQKDSLCVDEIPENLDIDDVSVLYRAEKIYLVSDDRRIHYWPSEVAIVIDLILIDVLRESITSWNVISPEKRLNLLATIRLFLQECPNRDPTIGKISEYETCCDEKRIFKTICESSDEVLFSRSIE